MTRLLRNTRLCAVVGIVAVVFGVIPILGGVARVAFIVAGVLLLLAAASRRLAPRSKHGGRRGPTDQPWRPDSYDDFGSGGIGF